MVNPPIVSFIIFTNYGIWRCYFYVIMEFKRGMPPDSFKKNSGVPGSIQDVNPIFWSKNTFLKLRPSSSLQEHTHPTSQSILVVSYIDI